MKANVVFLILLGSQFLATVLHSHELPENRAALVLRNDRLVTATLYLNLSEVLHKALMPKGDRLEHTARLAAMSDEEFTKQVNMAKKMIQSGVVFTTVAGKPLKVGEWQWPEAKDMQTQLREITMRFVVAPSQHFHESPIEVRVQTYSDEALTSLRVEMPDALRPITLIATRPRQGRLNLSTPSMVMNF